MKQDTDRLLTCIEVGFGSHEHVNQLVRRTFEDRTTTAWDAAVASRLDSMKGTLRHLGAMLGSESLKRIISCSLHLRTEAPAGAPSAACPEASLEKSTSWACRVDQLLDSSTAIESNPPRPFGPPPPASTGPKRARFSRGHSCSSSSGREQRAGTDSTRHMGSQRV